MTKTDYDEVLGSPFVHIREGKEKKKKNNTIREIRTSND
jgi:hypothetical protein